MTAKRPHKHIDTPPDLLLSSDTTYFHSIDHKRRCHGHPLTFPFPPTTIRGVEGTLDANGRVRDACGNDVDGYYTPQDSDYPRRGAVDLGVGDLGAGLGAGAGWQGGGQCLERQERQGDFRSVFGGSIFGSVCSSPNLPDSSQSENTSAAGTTAPTSADGEDEDEAMDLDDPAKEPLAFDIERGSPRRPTIPLPPLHDDSLSLAPDVARCPGGLSAIDGMARVDLSPSPSPAGSRSQSPAHYPSHSSHQPAHNQTSLGFAFQPFLQDNLRASGPPSMPLPPLPALPSALPALPSPLLALSPANLDELDDDALTTASLDSASEAALWEAAAHLLVPRRRRRAMSAPLRPGFVWADGVGRGIEAGVLEQ